MTFVRQDLVCAVVVGILSAATSGWASTVNISRDAQQRDPISGFRWQRIMDAQHPAAPPRLALQRDPQRSIEQKKKQRPTVCVRAGDRVLLHGERAKTASIVLEATALQNGVCGDHVRARVVVTGALVDMTVMAAGIGVLDGKAGAWR